MRWRNLKKGAMPSRHPFIFLNFCVLPFRGLGVWIIGEKELEIEKDAYGVPIETVIWLKIEEVLFEERKIEKKRKSEKDFVFFVLFVWVRGKRGRENERQRERSKEKGGCCVCLAVVLIGCVCVCLCVFFFSFCFACPFFARVRTFVRVPCCKCALFECRISLF